MMNQTNSLLELTKENNIIVPANRKLPQTNSIKSLSLNNFRNHASLSFQLTPAPVIITGPNGIGKTSILEAVSFLSPGRGLKSAKLNEIDHTNLEGKLNGPWGIKAEIYNYYGLALLETLRVSEEGDKGNKRIIKIDDQLLRSHTELAKYFSVIWLTPQMDQLFIASSSVRRKFFDRLVYNFDIAHATRVLAYENSMRQRAKLLRSSRSDKIWLNTLEHTMAESAVAIAAARVQVAEYIQGAIDDTQTPFPKARITIDGELEKTINNAPAIQLEEGFKKRLYALRSIDSQTGRTNAGIHRSDLLVYHAEKDIEASLCSTGEQKALLLSIILAEARARVKWRHSIPVLLLDEVVAHLDEARREFLFAEIIRMKAQSWITSTDIGLFTNLKNNAQFFELKHD